MSTGRPAPEVIAVAASAGGVEALIQFAGALPAGLDATIIVVLHVSPSGTTVLPGILSRAGALTARFAADGDRLVRGEILIAPPDRHLLVERGHVRLDRGPRENGHRPAADPTFRSLALACGPRAGAIVLSGMRGDGAAGLRRVKLAGGVALVQDPETALYPSMPSQAIAATRVDAVLGPAALAEAVAALVGGDHDRSEPEVTSPAATAAQNGQLAPPGDPEVRQICPECGGALTERIEGPLTYFTCHVGHRYSLDGLIEAQAGSIEQSLWAAVRVLRERAEILRRLGERMGETGLERSAASFLRDADEHYAQAETVLAAATSIRPIGESVIS